MLVANSLRSQSASPQPDRCAPTEADIEALVDILTPIVLRLLQQQSSQEPPAPRRASSPEKTPIED